MDATETLKLLPPLVQARDVKEFLIESLRVPRFDTRIVREIAKTRRDDAATRLMVLEEKRVKVVDSRMCVVNSPLHFPHIHPFAFSHLLFHTPLPTRPSRDIICSLAFLIY